MLAGYPPFFDDNPFGIYEKILSGKIDWPRQVEPVVKDLIKKLLVQVCLQAQYYLHTSLPLVEFLRTFFTTGQFYVKWHDTIQRIAWKKA